MIEKLYKIAEGLNNRFQDGDDPFYIVTRLAEECGEVASQVSHFERKGVKALKLGPPDRAAFAKELQDVMRAVVQLAIHDELESELEASVNKWGLYTLVTWEREKEKISGNNCRVKIANRMTHYRESARGSRGKVVSHL